MSVKELKYYTRDSKTGARNGCIMAIRNEDAKVAVVWSRCMKIDKFSKQIATHICRERAKGVLESGKTYPVPFSIEEEYLSMVNRSQRFFSGMEIIGQQITEVPRPSFETQVMGHTVLEDIIGSEMVEALEEVVSSATHIVEEVEC